MPPTPHRLGLMSLALAAVCFTGCGRASEVQVQGADGRFTADVYAMPRDDFFALDAVNRPLEPDHIDPTLLRAAVFHETNRRRAEHDLPPLTFNAQLEQAAQEHAADMARHRYVEHENPRDPERRWPMDRVRLTGYVPRSVSENVAKVFRVRYEPGRNYYRYERGGKTVFSYQPQGEPIPAHSYASFARFLLDEWMNSPGHRENILRQGSEQLGVGVEFDFRRNDLDEAYAAQVFGSPMR